MKFCPTCQTTYPEGTLKFCTKDGTALLPVANQTPENAPFQPNDADEETAFLKNKEPEDTLFPAGDKTNYLTPPPPDFTSTPASSRIVVSLEEPKNETPNYGAPPSYAPQSTPNSQNQPRKSNVALAVFLTFLATLIVLGGAGIGSYFVWQNYKNKDVAAANANANANQNANLTNANSTNTENPFANYNYNANANANSVTNTNLNANKTPTPKPSPSPTPKPSPSVSPTPNNSNANNSANANISNRNSNQSNSVESNKNSNLRPTPPNVPPTPTPASRPDTIPGGVVNGKAKNLVKPAYPPAARAVNASGQVTVQVTIDEEGNVTSAKALSGHPLLRTSAENAARQSRFTPTILSGQPVKVSGTIIYNFVPNQ